MLEAPKKSKPRKKNKDRTYHPRANRKRAPFNPAACPTENLLQLMQSAASPPPKALVLNSTSTQIKIKNPTPSKESKKKQAHFVSPSKVKLSTPHKGPKTTSAETPNGTKFVVSRLIVCEDGTAMGTFLPKNKVPLNELTIPKQPDPWIKNSPIPEADMSGIIDFKITKESIKAVDAVIRKRVNEGRPPRIISQNKLMKIPAVEALRKAGANVPDRGAQHTHLKPHCYGGDDAQTVANLGIATRQANAAMELVNPVIREALFQKHALPELYLSAIPEWVPGYEKIRLLKTITYIIKDAPGNNPTRSATIRFNMLSTDPVCLTDILPIKEFIIGKFSNKPALEKRMEKENSPLNSPYHTPTFDRKRKAALLSSSVPSSSPSLPLEPIKKLKFI